MVILAQRGSVSLDLERLPSADQLADIIRGAAAYWPHSAVVESWTLMWSGGSPILNLNWKVPE